MNALNAAMLALVLINVVSLSYGFVWGHWGPWSAESSTPCDSLCGGGGRSVIQTRNCEGGLICRPIEGGKQTITESCNIHSCDGICQQGCASSIANPESNSSYYHCAFGRALLTDCPVNTTFSHCTRSCR